MVRVLHYNKRVMNFFKSLFVLTFVLLFNACFLYIANLQLITIFRAVRPGRETECPGAHLSTGA